MFFFGQYEHTIDAKQRLAIPADARAVLDAAGNGSTFVVAPGTSDSICLWPERTFTELAQASLGGSFLGDARLVEFQRAIFSQAQRCPMDSAGRIRLPERLLSQYGLSGSVMVVGAMDHLEVIAPDKWKDKQVTGSAYDDMLQEARQAVAAKQRRESGS